MSDQFTVPEIVSTTEEAPAVLGGRTFRVTRTRYSHGDDYVQLTGPNGAEYFLRGYMRQITGGDDGLRQVISWKGGRELRIKGNEVRAIELAGVIEEYVPAPRQPRRR